jgi:hypothetical protein
MAFFGSFRTQPVPSGLPEWDGLVFALDDPRVPEGIAARVRADFGEGYPLFYTHTPRGGEWWLMDGDNLLEAYWLE